MSAPEEEDDDNDEETSYRYEMSVPAGYLGVTLSYAVERSGLEVTSSSLEALELGDVIVDVNGQPVTATTCDEAVRRLREARSENGDRLGIRRYEKPGQKVFERCLKGSKYFDATHVKVTDATSWYAQRSALGPRRHMARETVPNKFGGGTEGFYWKMVHDAPTRVSAGTALTPLQAWALADDACKRRDHASSEEKRRCFLILVVSPTFAGLDQIERTDLVVETLVESLGGGVHSEDVPRGFVPGPTVRLLPFCRRLPDVLARADVVALKLLTPAQWRPTTHAPAVVERYDAARTKPKYLGIPAKWKQKAKVSSKKFHNLLTAENDKEDPVRGHFFYGLPDSHRKFLLRRDTKARRALEAFRSPRESSIPTSPSYLKAKAIFENEVRIDNDAKSDAIAKNYKQLTTHHAMATKLETEITVRLQRLIRRSYFPWGFRRRNRRHLAATHLQRVARGAFGRRYAKLYADVAHLAATRLASRYRIVTATRRTARRRIQLNAAALDIERCERGRKARSYVRWVRRNWANATQLERGGRGFLIRARVRVLVITACFQRARIVAKRWSLRCYWPLERLPFTARQIVGPLASTRINAHVRRALAHVLFLAMWARHVFEDIIQPARLRIQKVWRGKLGRLEARDLRHQNRSATMVQKIVRGRLKRLWRHRRLRAMQERRSTTEIQRHIRGLLDRRVVAFVQKERHRHWVRTVLVPQLQAQTRGRQTREAIALKRQMGRAAGIVQRGFRAFIACRLIREKHREWLERERHRHATIIAKIIRTFQARSLYRQIRKEAVGARLRAARVILRAWLRYRAWQKFIQHREEWQVEKTGRHLLDLFDTRDDIDHDLRDIRDDMKDIRRARKWTKKRLQTIAEFVIDAELRIPVVEAELDKLDVDEIEQGWGEALENEWDRLKSQIALAYEEKKLLKGNLTNFDDHLRDLQLEYEEFDIDLDDVAVHIHETFELLRRLELERNRIHAVKARQRRIIEERMRWKVNDLRVNVLERQRHDLTDLVDHHLRPHRLDVASTMNFKKRSGILRRARSEALNDDAVRRSQRHLADLRSQAGAVEKLKDSYDTVIDGCANLLRAATVDLHHDKSQI